MIGEVGGIGEIGGRQAASACDGGFSPFRLHRSPVESIRHTLCEDMTNDQAE